MTVVYDLLLVLHLIGWAIVLGGALTHLRRPEIATGMLHGILTALVTGVAMVGIASSGLVDENLDNTKVGVKLLIALVVTALVVVGTRTPAKVTRGFVGAIAGLTVVNIAIAVLW